MEALKAKITGVLAEALLTPPLPENRQLALQFWQIFLESLPETMLGIHSGENDRMRLRKSAHRLKGACGFAGAIRLRLLAADLEQVAETLSAGELEYFCATLSQTADETAACMRQELAAVGDQ